MRISDWSSDVCSSDLQFQWRYLQHFREVRHHIQHHVASATFHVADIRLMQPASFRKCLLRHTETGPHRADIACEIGLQIDLGGLVSHRRKGAWRSEEHTSELQSLMRISYAVFCLKQKNN